MGVEAVGKRVRVYWETMDEYYEGVVTRYVRKVDEYWVIHFLLTFLTYRFYMKILKNIVNFFATWNS